MKDMTKIRAMSLKTIADILDVRHDNAMLMVTKMLNEDSFGLAPKIKEPIISGKGRKQYITTYLLDKRQSIAVAARLNTNLLMKIIDRWQELEATNSVNENWDIQRSFCKLGYKLLCKVVEQAHEEPKFFHYSNEADLINRIVLGMSAKQYRELNGVNTATRNTLDEITLFYINRLQAENERLIIEGIDFQTRKAKLETLHAWLSQGLPPKAEKKLKLKLVVNNGE